MTTSLAETTVSADALTEFCRDVLRAVGTPEAGAELVAASLTAADCRNIGSHGVVRLLPVYVRRLQVGATRATPNIQITRRRGVSLLVDGDAGLGQVVGSEAMRLAVETARELGAGVVGVRNSSHFGIGAFFVEQATRAGMVGISMSNATPNMPPAGGRSRFLGTNPLTIGVPGPGERPVMLDMATSVVARGKIVMAEKEGQTIPANWAIDGDGHPTQDATAALLGAVQPMAGYKGAGLAMMIDILSGVLTGAAFGPHVVDLYDQSGRHQNVGHLFAAIDVEAFMPLEDFRVRVGQFVDEVRAQPRTPDTDRIFLPGELEYEAEARALQHGIAISAAGLKELDGLAHRVGVLPLAARAMSISPLSETSVPMAGNDALAPG
jgi:LDH2 family malate/lactate/ureidoglycolate dehydrogenase